MIRREVLQTDGVTRLSPGRRFSSVFREGEEADRLYFLSSGLVKIFTRGKDGREVILRLATPCELFGEEAMSEGSTRSASAEVLQDAAIFTIPRQAFIEYADSSRDVWPLVTELLIGRQRMLERKIEMLCVEDVETRILQFVREMAERLKQEGQSGDFSIPLSQTELAAVIGATRETTSTTLNSLARRGILRLGRRMLTVPSFDGLRSSGVESAPRKEYALSATGSII
jgi:CRP/FNR family transcriptional regulator